MIRMKCVRWLVLGLALTFTALAVPPASKDAGKVAAVTARLFEQAHYSHHHLDESVSARFLTKYIEALDYNRMFFLQSDVAEFEKYRNILGQKTLAGDVSAAYEIFGRYEQRVDHAVTLVKGFLKESFTFNDKDSIAIDRTKAPWPANETEAATLWRQRVKYELLQEQLNKTKPEEAINLVSRRYERLLRTVRETDSEEVVETYLNALCHSYDPHSDYLGASELKNFQIGMKLSLFGIGAVLRAEDGYTKVVSLVPGGPADLDKRLKPNDRIVAVGEGDAQPVDVVGMKLNKVVELIRGSKGTHVKLTIIPAEGAETGRKVVTLVREEVKLTEQHAKAKVYELPSTATDAARGVALPRRIGVIDLPSFYADTEKERADDPEAVSTTRDVAGLIEKLKEQQVEAIVLDLRRNGGGLLDEAVALAGLFIKQGPVVQVKDYKDRIQVLEDEDSGVAYAGPLVVLTSHISASASEIFAAAMQDYGRAVVVGDSKTFGKGTVQTMVPLAPMVPDASQAGALKLTTQKFYRVAGGSTQNRGVIPDIILPSIYDVREIGESALDNAMPYDEVAAAAYNHIDGLADKITLLRQRSGARLEKDQDFAYLKEDITRMSAQIKLGKVSLDKAEREKEKKTDEARKESRKKERQARHAPEPKITEVVLRSSQMPAVADAAAAPKAASAQPTKSADDEEEDGEVPAEDKSGSTDAVLNEAMAIARDVVDASGFTAATVSNSTRTEPR